VILIDVFIGKGKRIDRGWIIGLTFGYRGPDSPTVVKDAQARWRYSRMGGAMA
jgi:hypothetical protein